MGRTEEVSQPRERGCYCSLLTRRINRSGDTYFRWDLTRGVGEIRITDVYQRPALETAVYDWFMSPEGRTQQQSFVVHLRGEVVCALCM